MDEINRGMILQAQNFSVNDGDGIRTTIFLAGCPLRCQWCANPEGFTIAKKVEYYENQCIQCGKCTEVCSINLPINLNEARKQCVSCGKCVSVCPTEARRFSNSEVSVDELVESISGQIPFFRKSNGGITFSGGEATMQTGFLRALANRFYDMGINLAIETCGYFDFESVRDIFSLMDLIFVDIKHMDSEKHKEFTTVGNEKILKNIIELGKLSIPIVVRIPVIKGVNATRKNCLETAKFVKKYIENPKVELLQYHRYGESKYTSLGIGSPSLLFEAPSDNEMEEMKQIFLENGIKVVSYK